MPGLTTTPCQCLRLPRSQCSSLSENLQDTFDRGGRRRHHTAGNVDHFPQAEFGRTVPNISAYDPLQSDPLQNSRQPQSSYRSSSYSNFRPHDPHALDDDGALNPDFSRKEQLEDLDDFGRYSSGQEADPHRSINCGDGGDEEGDEGAPFIGQDHLMCDSNDPYGNNNVPTKPTPLPKVPLFVLSVVIFSEPLTSTILFPFVYFMVCLIPYIQITFTPHSRIFFYPTNDKCVELSVHRPQRRGISRKE
ncbi:hypothetical protein BGZ92_009418 [Podila epicladia]|nr:hypothetical protein BGZ92_009418 [Podila epicladia]